MARDCCDAAVTCGIIVIPICAKMDYLQTEVWINVQIGYHKEYQ